MKKPSESKGEVALFVTCLVDLMRPEVGFASASLIEAAGFEVVVPKGQSCCGQPNYNGGDRNAARRMAERTIALLQRYERVVVPSGSCAAMIKLHYPSLFDEADALFGKARALADKTQELTTFLAANGYVPAVKLAATRVTYHDSCSGLRELGIHDQPRALLRRIDGLRLVELSEPEVCCGFGGTFCIKYPDISNRMVSNKTADIAATGASVVAMGDVGCLMNIEGRLRREGSSVRACHVAELLAGTLETPGGN
ncbi:(Fe-S)-binding protein [Iodidimonas sp. SYSU 1G8]|uniref:(Fe-S)-binding protein n=1 Tax=Iodidimonas sp. SYSU 1G8 TaxID=3133967 RepID=UPI0031FE9AD6